MNLLSNAVPPLQQGTGNLRLRNISLSDARSNNAIYQHRKPLNFQFKGEVAALKLLWKQHRSTEESALLLLRIGGTHGEVYLPKAWISRWLEAANGSAPTDSSVSYAALLLESYFADEIAWIETYLGEEIQLISVGANGSGLMHPVHRFTFELGSERCDCAVAIDRKYVELLVQLLQGQPNRANVNAVPVQVRLVSDPIHMALRAFGGLRPGDVIVIDGAGHNLITRWLVAADRLIAPISNTQGQLQLGGAFAPVEEPQWSWIMNNKSDAHTTLRTESAEFGDLPVTIVFEVGRKSLTISELEQLAPGSVITIADSQGPMVDVLANGKRVGSGELIAVGHGIGVQLHRLFNNA